MYTVFLWFYALMLCLNGTILYVDSVWDTDLVTPFDDTQTVTGITQPNINNGTGSLILNTTSSVKNATSGLDFSFLTESLYYSLQVIQNAISFLTGQFVWNVLEYLGMPDLFVGILQSVIAFFLALTIIHFWTGRI